MGKWNPPQEYLGSETPKNQIPLIPNEMSLSTKL